MRCSSWPYALHLLKCIKISLLGASDGLPCLYILPFWTLVGLFRGQRWMHTSSAAIARVGAVLGHIWLLRQRAAPAGSCRGQLLQSRVLGQGSPWHGLHRAVCESDASFRVSAKRIVTLCAAYHVNWRAGLWWQLTQQLRRHASSSDCWTTAALPLLASAC